MVCQGCVKGVSRVSRVCQGCVKGVSRVCQECVKGVKGVSRVCQGCVKGVMAYSIPGGYVFEREFLVIHHWTKSRIEKRPIVYFQDTPAQGLYVLVLRIAYYVYYVLHISFTYYVLVLRISITY